ncbi:MAG TPA: hypothetical protein VNC61_00325 [Acidimicrobiales bacterium]|nr:hypothetical protein [Acidimicrobiales bacterium]
MVTREPANQTVVGGQTATFTVAAIGSPAPTIQWQVSTDGGLTYSPIPWANSDTYSVTATAPERGEEFEAVISSALTTVTTAPATLNVFAITPPSGCHSRLRLPFPADRRRRNSSVLLDEDGSIPKGLSLSSKGVVSGTP